MKFKAQSSRLKGRLKLNSSMKGRSGERGVLGSEFPLGFELCALSLPA